jgi:hypothetical protein
VHMYPDYVTFFRVRDRQARRSQCSGALSVLTEGKWQWRVHARTLHGWLDASHYRYRGRLMFLLLPDASNWCHSLELSSTKVFSLPLVEG